MTLITIFNLLFIHWIADFIMQNESDALGKSKKAFHLFKHTLMYSSVWFIFGVLDMFFFGAPWDLLQIVKFTLITFIAHTITDYFTSRIVARKFANKEYGSNVPNFGAFTVIGFDQILHYIQIFTTYWVLVN